MKESPYYGSTSANESSTKDNNRTTTPNSNNSNSRSTRYLSYSHNVSKRNFFGILHHLSVITIIHFTEIQARLSESKQTSLEAMFSRRIDKISLIDSSLMKILKLRRHKENKMKIPGHQPHLGWKIQL